MKALKVIFIYLFFVSFAGAQKKSVHLKIFVLNNFVDKVFLRNKTDIVFQINSKKKGVFAASFEIEEGIYQLKYDSFYTDIYLKNGFNLKATFDGSHFYESLKFEGIGADENNFIASEFKRDENDDENYFYSLNEPDFEDFLISVEKNKLDRLLEGSFSTFFIDYEKKSIKAQLLKIRDLYQDRKLTQRKSN